MLVQTHPHPEPSLPGLLSCTRGTMKPEHITDSDVDRTIDNLLESDILLGLVLKTRFDANICRARRHIIDALTELRTKEPPIRGCNNQNLINSDVL